MGDEKHRKKYVRKRRAPKKHVPAKASETGTIVDKRYKLGDRIGEGGAGAVYKALDTKSGVTVAVKSISITQIKSSELAAIMQEIDLLKKLSHKNIVKYLGYTKTKTNLYIILEFLESGSLRDVVKRFGNMKEELIAKHMHQCLSGLEYLHNQGVIHRDIKGANILTDKNSHIKLTDFGISVSSGKSGGPSEDSGQGTPYWLAPESIKFEPLTPACDIWSLGCTAVELYSGAPPYFHLTVPQALYKIVNDDMPPLPDGISEDFADFLTKCFQKEPEDRPTATELLKHRFVTKYSKKEASSESSSSEESYFDSTSMDESSSDKEGGGDGGVKGSILQQLRNKAGLLNDMKDFLEDSGSQSESDGFGSFLEDSSDSRTEKSGGKEAIDPMDKLRKFAEKSSSDGDLDFESGEGDKLEKFKEDSDTDLIFEGEDLDLEKFKQRKRHAESQSEVSWEFDEVKKGGKKSNRLREERSRKEKQILLHVKNISREGLEGQDVADNCQKLIDLFKENPKSRELLIQFHGVIAITERLKEFSGDNGDVLRVILQLVFVMLENNAVLQETFCMVGGIPLLRVFSDVSYRGDIRKVCSDIVTTLCSTSDLVLQLFIAARGLPAIVDFLDASGEYFADIVPKQLENVESVLKLVSPTPKNDFRRIFVRHGLLVRLEKIFTHYKNSGDKDQLLYISRLLLNLSQGNTYVKEEIATPELLNGFLEDVEDYDIELALNLMEVVRHISIPANIEKLSEANVIKKACSVLNRVENDDSVSQTLQFRGRNQILMIIFNVCNLSPSRLAEAAKYGIIPILMKIIRENSPLKEFCIPLICNMPKGKGRYALRESGGLDFLVSLLEMDYWKSASLDAISFWLDSSDKEYIEQRFEEKGYYANVIKGLHKCDETNVQHYLVSIGKLADNSKSLCHGFLRGNMIKYLIDKLSLDIENKDKLTICRAVQNIVNNSDMDVISKYVKIETINRLERKVKAAKLRLGITIVKNIRSKVVGAE